jgi:hypothetical protein
MFQYRPAPWDRSWHDSVSTRAYRPQATDKAGWNHRTVHEFPLDGRKVMNWIGLATSIAAVILSVLCASLVWRQQRRLAAIQTHLNRLSRTIHRLEAAHSSLLIRLINSPKSRSSRKARKSSSTSSDTLEEKKTAPTQPDEKDSKGSALYVVAPKTSPK